MDDFISEPARRFVDLVGPEPDETQRAMQEHAAAVSFPIIGPAAGGMLTVLARLTGATRVFEFGSGFGYSASWFARGMGRGGEVVLAEVDADELDLAREYLGEAGYAPSFRYEPGDALEAIERYAGPFDLALIDHEKTRYVEGFERVRSMISPGGAVVADNMMAGPVDTEDVLAGLEGEPPANEPTAGVVDYLTRLRVDAAFVTVVVPVGSGVAVSVRRPE